MRVAAVGLMLQRQGFASCVERGREEGLVKVAVYAKSGQVTHLARQESNGRWTSKLGRLQLVEHDLDQLEGVVYGQVVAIYARRD